MAFNKDEELNLKYSMAVGEVHNKPEKIASKKRDITKITQSAPRASNPFRKEEVARLEIDQVPEMPVAPEEAILPQ